VDTATALWFSLTVSAAIRTCGVLWCPNSKTISRWCFSITLGPEALTFLPTYSALSGYAEDIIEIGHELNLKDAVFVGHSVSAMIGILATLKVPGMFGQLVLVGPSARYIDEGDYVGGFNEKQIAELLEFLEDNHMGWSAAMAPSIMGNPDRPELGEELTNSFCRTDPDIARAFARVTFTSDNRADLPKISVPTLILQCKEDIIASMEVGEFVHRQIPGSTMVVLDATGHCPNLSAPREVVSAIQAFV
jgi:sigma-B regulation protein RsbQ